MLRSGEMSRGGSGWGGTAGLLPGLSFGSVAWAMQSESQEALLSACMTLVRKASLYLLLCELCHCSVSEMPFQNAVL